MKLKCLFISDSHSKHHELGKLPKCDILFYSGDWSFQGLFGETQSFAKWLNDQPAKHIVIIPGNHELAVENHLPESRTWITEFCPRAHLLIHESIEVEGLKIFGSPYTPYFNNWAWNAGRDITEASHTFKPFIGDLWKDIPEDTQILLTHGPALGLLDDVFHAYTGKIEYVGCKELYNKIKQLKKLKVHAFGHTHFKGGTKLVEDGVTFINAALCDDRYKIHRSRVVKLTV